MIADFQRTIKFQDIPDIITKINPIAQKRIRKNFSIYLKTANVLKLHHHRMLHQVPADSKVYTRTLLPVYVDCPRINNLPLKGLSFGLVLDATGKLNNKAVLTQQHMAVTYRISNNTSSIARMEPSVCIVDGILKSPGIRMMNTQSMVK
jgi:hypothetical protein